MITHQVVLDTNVLLSGIAYPASVPGKIMALWRLGTLLAARRVSGEVVLITGDKDLLVLAERYPIFSPAAFHALHIG